MGLTKDSHLYFLEAEKFIEQAASELGVLRVTDQFEIDPNQE